MRYRVFVDMDDVLVDFQGAALKAFGVTKEQFSNRQVQEWDMCPGLGVTLEQFWDKIHSLGAGFWETLEPLPWIDSLLEFVSSRDPEWYILSSPSRDSSSYVGKINWLKYKFGNGFNKFVLTNHKHLLAGHGCLLIDDKEENIAMFKARGGKGILFPHGSNSLQHLAQDPLPEVIRQFNQLS